MRPHHRSSPRRDFCGTRNWYTGNEGALGDANTLGPAEPKAKHHFKADKEAPALLGFDESIDGYCQNNGGKHDGSASGHAIQCVQAQVNILSLYGDKIPYNTCRNAEWQVGT